MSEFEDLAGKGHSANQSFGHQNPAPRHDDTSEMRVHFSPPDENVLGRIDQSLSTSPFHPPNGEPGLADENQSADQSQQDCQCAEECILKESFCRSEFDGEKFLSLADSIMSRLFSDSEKTKKDSFKARVVSSISRKLSIILSLSRSQNEQLLHFWKTMMTFIHPGSDDVVRKFHASSTSCIRSCMEKEQKKKELTKRQMRECSFLSIAVDSALVRNEHLLSCFVRFSFEEQTLQTPLFFAICPSTTGSGQAHFIYNKLVEHDTPFEKLVSVSTDGASSMIGGNVGMVACLKSLVQHHCSTNQTQFNDFHSVWCFAHRLNLATKDFLELKGVNVVKSFADWFSD